MRIMSITEEGGEIGSPSKNKKSGGGERNAGGKEKGEEKGKT